MSAIIKERHGFGDRVYRLMLWLLPAPFRASYADEILTYHRARMDEEVRCKRERAKVWVGALWDVAYFGLLERTKLISNAATRVFGALSLRTSRGGPPREPRWRRALQLSMFFDPIAVRRILKSPRFAIVTILTLGLGIGANTALFSVVHSVLLNPLPYEDADNLVFAWETRGESARIQAVSLGNFEEWRHATHGLQDVAAARFRAFNVTGFDPPIRVSGLEVSAGLLSLLGANPIFGREFLPEEEKPGAEPVCLVAYSFWLDRFGGNTDLSDLRLTLNGRSYSVVGIIPVRLQIPGFGERQILTPLPLDPGHIGYWSNHNTTVYGRLASADQIDQAGEELSSIASRLEEAHPEWNEGIGTVLVPAREQLVQGARRTLWILFGTVGFVLFIACVNVASLMLARASTTEREMAVRVALGASRFRIVKLLLSEAFLLSAASGLFGLAVGYWGVEAIQRWGPASLPRMGEIEVSVPVLLFTLACAVLTGIVFGLLPALRASRVNIQFTLNKAGRSPGLAASIVVQRTLVVAEVAIAVVLLTGAGLLLKTFSNLLDVDPGFNTDKRVAMQLSLPGSRYEDRSSVADFLDRLHEKLDATPGIEASGTSVGLPFQSLMWRKYMTLEHRPALTLPEVPIIDLSISTPGYVRAMGIQLVAGRALLYNDTDESPYVALVNEAFLRTLASDEDILGKRLRLAAPDHLLPEEHIGLDPWYTVVGVVRDVRRWSLSDEPLPEVYISQRQDLDNAHDFFVVAHTALSDEAAASVMRQAVWDTDPELPVAWVRPIDGMMANAVAQPRFNASLIGMFGLSALLLALVGVYGLMANLVSARTKEIGVRIALGAGPTQILTHVAGQGITAAILGIVIGLVVAAAVTRVMDSLLFGIQPVDLPTFLVVLLAVLLVAGFAACVPSWRAAKLNAVEALGIE